MGEAKSLKPVVKWVGGKRQLLEYLIPLVPAQFKQYFEPFAGGGALFFALEPKKAFINDKNTQLIEVYETIRDHLDEFIECLAEFDTSESSYYEIRSWDRDPEFFESIGKIKRAARFLYLNKTCYNGLYRVNSRGEFNVPFGKYSNPRIVDEENLRNVSIFLQSSDIHFSSQDFEYITEHVGEEDLIYLDPPYVPISATANFTSYTAQGFSEEDQIRLKELCTHLHNKGAYFMLSNSGAELVYDLYSEFTIREVPARRSINSQGNKRGHVNEVVVFNYK